MTIAWNAAWPGGRAPSLVERELVHGVDWLISLRWLAGAVVLAAPPLAAGLLRVPLPVDRLVATGFAILGYNAGLWLIARWLRARHAAEAPSFESFARLQIGLDWITMAELIALSGGAESPAIVFFLFHIAVASLLLPHRLGFLYVTVAPLLVGAVAWLEYRGVIAHVAVIEPPRYRDPLFVTVVVGFFAVACWVLAYSCMTIASRLRRRERELGGLYESVGDIVSSLDLPAVLDRIVEAAVRVLGCRAAAIRLTDSTRSQVEFAASCGLSETYRGEVPAEYARSPLDQDTLRDGVVSVADVTTDARVWHPEAARDEGVHAMLSVAIPGRAGGLGVLRAYGGPGHRFTTEDEAYLRALAAHGAVAIENARAYRLLAELDRDKSRFLRTTTHELRAPVRVTEALLFTLAQGYVGPLGPEQRDLLERAQRRLHALHALVDDLLALAAGKSGLESRAPTWVDARSLLAEVAERFAPIAREKGVALAAPAAGEVLLVWADPSELERIVVNLVSNAVQYTPSGRVDVSLERDDGGARLRVRDTGIGIPEDARAHVFDEFFRASNARVAAESGTGLGLAIVKLLIERIGARISVASEPGRGSTFTVDLPAAIVRAGVPECSASADPGAPAAAGAVAART